VRYVICALLLTAALTPVQWDAESADGTGDGHWLCGFPVYELYAAHSRASSRYLAASGEHADIYVESGHPTQAQIDDLLDEFDHVIWPNITRVFGNISRNRITIVLKEIDGPYGIGGYYVPGGWSIYIDVADLSRDGHEIAAHEFQHLIHDKHDGDEDLWVNEGMSMMAMHVLYHNTSGSSLPSYIRAFENNHDNSLTEFDNTMTDYGQVYVFMEYIYEHYGGEEVLRNIVDNPLNGIDGIVDTLNSMGYSTDFTSVFMRWTAANMLDETVAANGTYGYREIDINIEPDVRHANYPLHFGGSVEAWAADYIMFENGTGLSLVVDFMGDYQEFAPQLVLLDNVTVLRMDITGVATWEGVVHRFGTSIRHVALITTSLSTGGDYNYTADLRDMVPPLTAVHISPEEPDGENGWYVSVPEIWFGVSEDADTYFWWDSGMEEMYCTYCSPPVVPVPPQGVHTLHYYSVDLAGNREDVKNITLMVDSIPPWTEVITDPAEPDGENGWFVSDVVVYLTAHDAEVTYHSLDGGEYAVWNTSLHLSEGVHTLRYYSVDQAGNEEEVNSTVIKVDRTPPECGLTVYPEVPNGRAGWYVTQPLVSLDVPPGATGYYQWDEGKVSEYITYITVPQGIHTLHYWAVDEAGNTGDAGSWTVMLDTDVPSAEVYVAPDEPDGADGWYTTLPRIYMSTQSDADVMYRWEYESSFHRYRDYLVPEEGEHTLYYYAVDRAGNREDTRSISLRVDTVPPELRADVFGSGSGEWYHETPEIRFTHEGELYCAWDGEEYTRCPDSMHALEGKHVLRYYAADQAGNRAEVQSLTLWVDTQDPEVALEMPLVAAEDSPVQFVVHAEDENGLVSCRLDYGDGFHDQCGNTTHTYASGGIFTVSIRAEDASGRVRTLERVITVEAKQVYSEKGAVLNPELAIIAVLTGVLVVLAYKKSRPEG